LGLNLPSGTDVTKLRAPTFEIYDISDQFNEADDPKEFTAKFPLGGQSYAKNFIEKHSLKPLSRQTGNKANSSIDFIVPGCDAYLIVQTDENGVIENAGNNGTFTLPFVFLMNDDFKIDDQGRMWFQIKGKTSLVQRSAYFFKYGKNAGGELPLSDAKFVLYRLDGSIKLYCTNNGGFKASASPLSDDEIAKFTSNSAGLVMYDRESLDPGTYYFSEVQAPKGYRITDEARKIEVYIPKKLSDGVKVNGTALEELYDQKLSDGAVSAAKPRIYNYSIENPPSNSGKTNTPGKPNTPTTPNSVKKKVLWGMLPQTGEAKSIMALLGIGIICLVVLVSVKRRNYKEEH
jgi:LPXTG-motif cell wall-anchored protein